MNSRALIRWSERHERRARSVPAVVAPLVGGGVLAAWVWWRSSTGIMAASHGWLAGAMVAYAVAFMRVPFHIYWRADAALLAQLPIEGRPLFDAALVRCVRAALATTMAAVIGVAPILALPGGAELAVRHAAVAIALGAAAGLLLPGVTVGAATLVVHGGERLLRAAVALGGAPARAPAAATPTPGAPPSASATLGALPGFAATFVLGAVLLVAPWLYGESPRAPALAVLGAIVAASAIAAVAARAGSGIMGRVLRDVSALDRQRLAALEIKPPTPIERAIARLIGAGRLAYEKDARLMRRRYPMAFALGGLVFVVLVLVGLARPADPMPWLAAVIGGAASYGLVLAGRLRRPPIELARLSATLPLPPRARRRAKLAWLLGWWSVFAVAPAVFAALRQPEPVSALALIAGATAVMIVAGALQR
ncbi:MAG TPA: hypothetical protein VHT91_18385 [Kofleriaceae bacterium]|nr:hypothetical protein [Kofleriaceae bacterium]